MFLHSVRNVKDILNAKIAITRSVDKIKFLVEGISIDREELDKALEAVFMLDYGAVHIESNKYKDFKITLDIVWYVRDDGKQIIYETNLEKCAYDVRGIHFYMILDEDEDMKIAHNLLNGFVSACK